MKSFQLEARCVYLLPPNFLFFVVAPEIDFLACGAASETHQKPNQATRTTRQKCSTFKLAPHHKITHPSISISLISNTKEKESKTQQSGSIIHKTFRESSLLAARGKWHRRRRRRRLCCCLVGMWWPRDLPPRYLSSLVMWFTGRSSLANNLFSVLGESTKRRKEEVRKIERSNCSGRMEIYRESSVVCCRGEIVRIEAFWKAEEAIQFLLIASILRCFNNKNQISSSVLKETR